jgi:hypothetical protein
MPLARVGDVALSYERTGWEICVSPRFRDDAGHLFFWEEPLRSAELVRDLAAVPA